MALKLRTSSMPLDYKVQVIQVKLLIGKFKLVTFSNMK